MPRDPRGSGGEGGQAFKSGLFAMFARLVGPAHTSTVAIRWPALTTLMVPILVVIVPMSILMVINIHRHLLRAADCKALAAWLVCQIRNRTPRNQNDNALSEMTFPESE